MSYNLLFYTVICIFFISCSGKGFKDSSISVDVTFGKTRQANHRISIQQPQIVDITPTNDSFQTNENLTKKQILYKVQKEWKKTPYVLGGVKITGADCSGFVQTVFKKEFNTTIPRTTVYQMRSGINVSKSMLKTGDLIFFNTGAAPNGYHVGIYIANGNFVHLSSHGGARIQNINMKYWKTKYILARRYLK